MLFAVDRQFIAVYQDQLVLPEISATVVSIEQQKQYSSVYSIVTADNVR